MIRTRKHFVLGVTALAMLFSSGLTAFGQVASQTLNTTTIERLTGAKGTLDRKESVFKVSAPRSDLSIIVAGVKMKPAMGLTSWAAFKRTGSQDMVMGDMVVLEDQVNPVMGTVLDNGLEVTALHNHFMWDSPKVMFMHIGGMGEETAMASAVGKVLAKIKATSGGHGEQPIADIDPAQSSLNTVRLDSILGLKGQYKDGVYKFVVGCNTRMHDLEIGNQMGVNTWGAFAGSDNKAIVDGDFAMRDAELQNVLKTLHKAGINIVAIHQHMVGEEPRIMFLHYWGVAPAGNLAKGLKAAMDLTRD